MEDKKIGIDKIKVMLSMCSMALLAIQHFVGLFADDINVSYIPLAITFLTIFVGTLDSEEQKAIKIVSLILTILIILAGVCINTITSYYGLDISKNIYNIYTKIMFGTIGSLSLTLSILYVKRVCELN